MSVRSLSGLISARELASPPPFARKSRARGAKREGLKYENAFVLALGSRARHGTWIQFTDKKGMSWAQPDALLDIPGFGLAAFECKYTWVAEGEEKLRKLYIPLLERVYGGRVFGIVVCKKLAPGAKHITANIADAVKLANQGLIPTLHWRPEWNLFPSPTPKQEPAYV